MAVKHHFVYTRPEQASKAEKSNYTYIKYSSDVHTRITSPENGFIIFRPDGSFEFSGSVKEVLDSLANCNDYFCKGLATLITTVYEAGLNGKEIPKTGKPDNPLQVDRPVKIL